MVIVTTNELAEELKTRAASVTDMLKKLKEQKLLNYEPYKGVKLSGEGRKVAVQIVRKHRLWEFFLVEKLQFPAGMKYMKLRKNWNISAAKN